MSFDSTKDLLMEADELLDQPRRSNESDRFKQFLTNACASIFSVGFATLIVSIAFSAMIKLIGLQVPTINREECDCKCWDGLFKGHYGRGTFRDPVESKI